MDEQGRNLLIAAGLSFALVAVWTILMPPQQPPPSDPTPQPEAVTEVAPAPAPTGDGVVQPGTGTDSTAAPSTRVAIETPSLFGSLSLRGGRIDDLSLAQYRETLDERSPPVRMLQRSGRPGAYYAVYGWVPAGGSAPTPGPTTEWGLLEGDRLEPGRPVVLGWDNGAGLVFRRRIEVDSDYLFTVTQQVQNTSTADVFLAPYGIVARHGHPDTIGFYILHEGGIGMFDGQLVELDYDDIADLDPVTIEGGPARRTEVAGDGWLGFTDKYWMTAMLPAAGQSFTAVFKAPRAQADAVYQADFRLPPMAVAAGDTISVTTHLFSGAKEVDAIRSYQTSLSIDRFEDAVDWGWFFFLTKPIFGLLSWVNGHVGNMGYSILILTLLVKTALFPLAYKSYKSMARMKKLQPEMAAIKERVGDDRARMQQEVMALYKKEKVNPAAGCLPILLQIPIFFSLYKVLFVTIEMRHAPFVGWIRDLAAPDPTTLFNLFGLIPWTPPEFLGIGFWPILMGVTMWLQMKLNPTPTDPLQQKIFAWMPVVFTFMLGRFPAGLVIYWTANNVLTALQQYTIMRLQGVEVDFFGNIRATFRRRAAGD